ncbi:MAG TPA: hypothetical protein VHG91_21410 [Longimicrobium sp.]|nr:hypothetical protein [Longimicrobium sp.]
MSDGFEVEVTDDARREIWALGNKAAVRIVERIRYVKGVGWQASQQNGLIKNLGDIEPGMFEILVKGRGEAYRVFCFPVGMRHGRLVVLTSCVAKSKLLGRGLQRHVQTAAQRRDEWLRTHKERSI